MSHLVTKSKVHYAVTNYMKLKLNSQSWNVSTWGNYIVKISFNSMYSWDSGNKIFFLKWFSTNHLLHKFASILTCHFYKFKELKESSSHWLGTVLPLIKYEKVLFANLVEIVYTLGFIFSSIEYFVIIYWYE